MRFPTDYGVDRPDLEDGQPLKVTGTNTPTKNTNTTPKVCVRRVHYAVSDTPHPPTTVNNAVAVSQQQ